MPRICAPRTRPLSPQRIGLLLLATTLALPTIGASPIAAQERTTAVQRTEAGTARRLNLGVGKSVVIDLPREARDVIVANPAIANAIVRSARRVFLIGVAVGQTNVFFLDGEGRQILGVDVEVGRDLGGLRATLRQALPNSSFEVQAVNDAVVISGQAATPLEAQQAVDIATRLVGAAEKVVNAMTIRGRDQVSLRVTVSEIQRSAVRQLGVNLQAFDPTSPLTGQLGNAGGFVYGLLTNNPVAATNALTVGQRVGNNVVTGTIRALEENGLARILAEPTLTAVSGEQARFLAGGEVPIPAGRDLAGNLAIEFKPFGVGLAFTPVVLSEGKISLRIGVEVSEPDPQRGISANGVQIPGFRTRRADTTVELPSGGSMMLAGLIREESRTTISGLPGIGSVPILGALFRSRDFQRNVSELVVTVTPYIVRHVSPNQLARPDDNFVEASDPAGVLIGRLNRIYGTAGTQQPPRRLHGPVGFIRD